MVDKGLRSPKGKPIRAVFLRDAELKAAYNHSRPKDKAA